MAKTVPVVDDNAYIRQALCAVFKREPDFEVCGEAENGREAVAKARELHPDLIVLDLSMPVMNGLDAARELKRLMPTVPLIMYSAFHLCGHGIVRRRKADDPKIEIRSVPLVLTQEGSQNRQASQPWDVRNAQSGRGA
jgi:chemotaxis response regulator CheB